MERAQTGSICRLNLGENGFQFWHLGKLDSGSGLVDYGWATGLELESFGLLLAGARLPLLKKKKKEPTKKALLDFGFEAQASSA